MGSDSITINRTSGSSSNSDSKNNNSKSLWDTISGSTSQNDNDSKNITPSKTQNNPNTKSNEGYNVHSKADDPGPQLKPNVMADSVDPYSHYNPPTHSKYESKNDWKSLSNMHPKTEENLKMDPQQNKTSSRTEEQKKEGAQMKSRANSVTGEMLTSNPEGLTATGSMKKIDSILDPYWSRAIKIDTTLTEEAAKELKSMSKEEKERLGLNTNAPDSKKSSDWSNLNKNADSSKNTESSNRSILTRLSDTKTDSTKTANSKGGSSNITTDSVGTPSSNKTLDIKSDSTKSTSANNTVDTKKTDSTKKSDSSKLVGKTEVTDRHAMGTLQANRECVSCRLFQGSLFGAAGFAFVKMMKSPTKWYFATPMFAGALYNFYKGTKTE